MPRNVRASLVVVGWVVIGCSLIAPALGGCDPAAGGELAVHDMEPRAGSAAGEQPVRITGANFRQDIGYAVYFGANRAGQVVIMDDSTLLVATPAHDPGTVDVVIAADDGPAYRIVGGFEFSDQGGNVMEQVGEPGAAQGEERF